MPCSVALPVCNTNPRLTRDELRSKSSIAQCMRRTSTRTCRRLERGNLGSSKRPPVNMEGTIAAPKSSAVGAAQQSVDGHPKHVGQHLQDGAVAAGWKG
jgi:hypothetical protein